MPPSYQLFTYSSTICSRRSSRASFSSEGRDKSEKCFYFKKYFLHFIYRLSFEIFIFLIFPHLPRAVSFQIWRDSPPFSVVFAVFLRMFQNISILTIRIQMSRKSAEIIGFQKSIGLHKISRLPDCIATEPVDFLRANRRPLQLSLKR